MLATSPLCGTFNARAIDAPAATRSSAQFQEAADFDVKSFFDFYNAQKKVRGLSPEQVKAKAAELAATKEAEVEAKVTFPPPRTLHTRLLTAAFTAEQLAAEFFALEKEEEAEEAAAVAAKKMVKVDIAELLRQADDIKAKAYAAEAQASTQSAKVLRAAEDAAESTLEAARDKAVQITQEGFDRFRNTIVPTTEKIKSAEVQVGSAKVLVAELEQKLSEMPETPEKATMDARAELIKSLETARESCAAAEATLAAALQDGEGQLATAEKLLADAEAEAEATVPRVQQEVDAALREAEKQAADVSARAVALAKSLLLDAADLELMARLLRE